MYSESDQDNSSEDEPGEEFLIRDYKDILIEAQPSYIYIQKFFWILIIDSNFGV